jgi:hypothetical protein
LIYTGFIGRFAGTDTISLTPGALQAVAQEHLVEWRRPGHGGREDLAFYKSVIESHSCVNYDTEKVED